MGTMLASPHCVIAGSPSTTLPPPPSQSALQPRQYQTQEVIFEAPSGFSDLQPLGNQTMGIIFPATALEPLRVSVRLAALKPAALGMESLAPQELAEYARYRFLGIASPPKSHKIRRVMGQEITGDILIQPNNGTTTYLEFYLVPLSLQRQLVIAFEADTELPVYLLEQTIQTVTASLREVPLSKKQKKR
jgi:hypothetical protein